MANNSGKRKGLMQGISVAVTRDMRRSSRLRGLLESFRQADSVIAGKRIKTLLTSEEEELAPAWTNDTGTEITFNAPLLGEIESKDDYVRLNGLNYHELSHVLYTPSRGGSRTNNAIWARGRQHDGDEFLTAFYALEDQRIESMMITRARAVRPYFEKIIADYILSNPETEDYSILMLAGRKYLGEEIIEAAKEKWGYDAELLEEGLDIIEQYRVLDMANQMHVLSAVSLAVRYMDLLRKISPPKPPCLPHGEGDEDAHGGMDDSDSRDQRNSRAASTAVAAGRDLPQDKGDDKQQGAGKGDQDGDEEDKGNQGKGEGGKDPGEDEGDDPDVQGVQGRGGSADDPGPGAGDQEGNHEGGTDLEQLLEHLSHAVGESFEVEADYETFQGMVRAGRIGADHVTRYPHWAAGASSDVTSLVNVIEPEWRRLVERTDPGWSYREDSGRFNVQRYALGEREIDQLFDSWEEGQTDATSIEGVLLLDISGSVGSWQTLLSGAAWTSKRVFDSIDAPLTIIAFDGSAYMVYSRDEHASSVKFPSFRCTGGTDPTYALQEALAILSVSPRKKRYLCTMTDGDWYGSGGTITGSSTHLSPNDLVAAIRSLPGAVTQMVYFDPTGKIDGKKIAWHNHEVCTMITDMAALPQVHRRAVASLIAAR